MLQPNTEALISYDVVTLSLMTFLSITFRTMWGLWGTSSGRPRNVCRIRPQDIGRGRPMALHIGQYWDVLRTLHWEVLRTSYFNALWTSVGDVPWRYIEDDMGKSIGRILGTSSGRPRDVILQSGWLFYFLSVYNWCHKINTILKKFDLGLLHYAFGSPTFNYYRYIA